MTEDDFDQLKVYVKGLRRNMREAAQESRLKYLEVESATREVLPLCDFKTVKLMVRWDWRTNQFLAACQED